MVGTQETLVAFESPKRLVATLALLAEKDPGRQVAVCRELTKLHEEVRRGSAAEIAAHYEREPPRGEVVLAEVGEALRSLAQLRQRRLDAGLVEIGDLRLDATTRARLGALRDAVSPGHLYESSLNRND